VNYVHSSSTIESLDSFFQSNNPANSLYLKLCAVCSKSAASYYKTFGNVSLTLIPRTFWRRHLRN